MLTNVKAFVQFLFYMMVGLLCVASIPFLLFADLGREILQADSGR